VEFGPKMKGLPAAERHRIADRFIELVKLRGFEDRYPTELSGGMQQRVGLARALATNADILLMDEPFSALDPLIRRKLQDELLVLQDRVRKTILFVSHDLDEALKLGDKVTILEGGRIVQTGTGRDIVERPADDYVAEFVRHVNPRTAIKGAAVSRGFLVRMERPAPDLQSAGYALDRERPAAQSRIQMGAGDEERTICGP